MSAFGAATPRTGSVSQCPCGSGLSYADCCQPLHDGTKEAESAVRLMRSRYSAYVVHDTAYLLRTWHPRTRPHELDASTGPAWRRLTVLETADGRDSDSVGEVEFEAAHDGGVLHERSRFVKRAGHWVYVDGDVD
ncbi:SEC-C motif-containing protein [Pedococcus dokdonensis]|uniref:UPF0225 protein SAMN04489867_1315 n=1 Tax=Pedococcus dokdonensis TaxID=443156 RepID=A0A1H0PNY8_9MICO|nr:YchJ family metal-binding protein [Pedococcus dokdonensis]SDP06298.1 SEC-C motif-containing protein [Pedococcus dokdonensis]